MSKESAIRFLREMRSNEKTKDLLQGLGNRQASKPSSMDPNHKPIYNSRESSGKKPGGQPGHQHHPRRQFPADETREVEMPQEYKDGYAGFPAPEGMGCPAGAGKEKTSAALH